MGIAIDLVVILFILACVFFGYKKGLVKLGIHLLSFVIAILITFILYRPIADFVIQYTTIDETIENAIVDKMVKNNINQKEDMLEELIDNTKDKILLEVAKPITYNIICTGVMILLFIFSKILLLVISSFADIITKLPIIEQFNKVGGILYGIIIGFFITYVILLIVSFIAKVNPENYANKEIENTYLTKLMYENNILNIFLK